MLYILLIQFLVIPFTKSDLVSSDYNVVTIDLEIPKKIENLEIQSENLKDSKITHGNPATNGQFPFAAYLHIRRGSVTSFCTGSLLSSDWIITARSCFV